MHPLTNEIGKFIPSDRIRVTRYDPLVRTPFFRSVQVPDEIRNLEPFTIIQTASADEISKVLKLANIRKLPVYVRQGMGVISPDVTRPEPPGSLILDLSKMHWINPNFDRHHVEVGPAVSEWDLNKALHPEGYGYPELIGPVTWCGSLVSLNSSGRSVDPYIGKPRNYVLGMEVVLPTGEIVETGSESLRRVCGFDLGQLVIGGQCMFGVITNLRLQLLKSPKDICGALVHFDSLASLGKAVSSIYKNHAPYPQVLEILNRSYLEAMEFEGKISEAVLMMATDGWAPGEAQWKQEQLIKHMQSEGCIDVEVQSSEDWAKLLLFREAGLSKLSPKGLVMLTGEVMDYPIDKLSIVLPAMRKLQLELMETYPGIDTYIIGHIGAGSFHPTVVAPVEWGYRKLHEVVKDCRKKILAFKLEHGATIGEQGIFPEHIGWYQGTYDDVHWKSMQLVKGALDPNGILNPIRYSHMQEANALP